MYYFVKLKKIFKKLYTALQLLRIILFSEHFCVNKKLLLVMDIFVEEYQVVSIKYQD